MRVALPQSYMEPEALFLQKRPVCGLRVCLRDGVKLERHPCRKYLVAASSTKDLSTQGISPIDNPIQLHSPKTPFLSKLLAN